jgi:hypothetical protein
VAATANGNIELVTVQQGSLSPLHATVTASIGGEARGPGILEGPEPHGGMAPRACMPSDQRCSNACLDRAADLGVPSVTLMKGF